VKLTDAFEHVQHRDIKKNGVVVAQVDYVGWSQVADRLDQAAPGWAFEVVTLSEDWCLGKLTIDGRAFMNVGYAENADADWKKEALKDAVSDALKRCAALAGVARYLYDKDTRPSVAPRPLERPQTAAAPVPAPTPRPAADEPPWPVETIAETGPLAQAKAALDAVAGPTEHYGPTCPKHVDRPWKDTGYGPKCTAKDDSGPRGYCQWKPTKRWVAEQELAA
jgi:hypothetical protein